MARNRTHPKRLVVDLVNLRTKRIQIVGIGEIIEAAPDYVAVLAFHVGGGDTRLISHAVHPRPAGEWESFSETTKWLTAVVEASVAGVDIEGLGRQLSTRLIRSVNTGDLERSAREYVRRSSEQSLVSYWPKGVGGGERKSRTRRGGGDLLYAQAAARYVELLTHPRPIAQLADDLGVARNTASSYIFRARERGLLTDPPVPGKPGGELTERAINLLSEEGN